ncbi:MAG: SUMF1/EgtB/PvdO family nonheme iron enzyme [Pseudomonadota bacterium]
MGTTTRALLGWVMLGGLVLACQPSATAPRGTDAAANSRERFPGKAGIEWVFSKPAGLYFAKTETTEAQFRACIEDSACSWDIFGTSAKDSECNFGYEERGSHPMNCTTLPEAKVFCAWAGGRLPTAGEWGAEASNAGTRTYPWGRAKPSCGRAVMGDGRGMHGCGREGTWPVCSRPSGNSVSGLCDMSGNVWEDCTPADGSHGMCGGSWRFDYPDEARASSRRTGGNPDGRGGPYGFRCVRPSP